MKILVFNAGSSSLKFGIFDMDVSDSRVFKAEFEAFHGGQCVHRCGAQAAQANRDGGRGALASGRG